MPLDTNSLMSIAMLVVLVVVFYFMLIRPESKRKKEAAKMRSELAVSDFITTIGGIMGTICAVKEDSIVIETGADRVRIELATGPPPPRGPRPPRTPTPPTRRKSKAPARSPPPPTQHQKRLTRHSSAFWFFR